MNLNRRSMSLHRLAKQITLCNGGVDVWYLPYDPAIQNVIYRQIKATRASGEDEYEPLELEVAALKKQKKTKINLARIADLATEISAIKTRYGMTWLGSFVYVDSCIVDVQLLDEDNLDALAIDCYWQGRNGNDPLGNFDLFCQILNTNLIAELYAGYDDTRAKLPPAPKETQEDAPPKDNPLEQSGSQVEKGKRGKKPIAETS